MYKRLISLDKSSQQSFFLWGLRQAGKTTLLEQEFKDAMWIQLLKSETYNEFLKRPQLLRERMAAQNLDRSKWVVIDEVQKIPELLNEVHLLIEDGYKFALCGSSARKLKRGAANLLGGRALRYELYGLTSAEIGKDFDLLRILNRGYLPRIYDSENFSAQLRAYCSDYLKEEIFSEGLVQSLAPFSQFLDMAALCDTQILSYTSFARDVGKSAPTIKSYFEILNDTLLGSFLPAYILKPKRQIKKQPKFYFSDLGVVNSLTQRGEIKAKTELLGKAFENWVHHELKSYLSYKKPEYTLCYWSLSSGVEVDFIVGHMKAAFESKASESINPSHMKGLRELKKEHPLCGHRYVVSLEPESRITEDGIHVLSIGDFTKKLWSNNLFD
ncbi:ATP-binding protein [bacterium]|nr:ATP-binding protein [bacterium]